MREPVYLLVYANLTKELRNKEGGREEWDAPAELQPIFPIELLSARSTRLSCQLNDADPFDYFYDLLWRINDHTVSRLDELLPDRWKPIRKPQDYWDTLSQDTTGKGWCWMGLAGCILPGRCLSVFRATSCRTAYAILVAVMSDLLKLFLTPQFFRNVGLTPIKPLLFSTNPS